MSTAEEIAGMSDGSEDYTSATGVAPESSWWTLADDRLSALGDFLNPILVKETRQALKSRQFTASFWLVLLFATAWSFIGISMLMPHVYYFPTGRFMLVGYFVILCVPLLLIVPFSAFRSLATEREDGTYELLSITALSARQIVTGKLGSALMQMLVYYAALAPCIAFTYLLRGLDFGMIVVLLVGTFLASILFSCVGLVFAGLNRSRQWQALASVLLLLLLIAGGWSWGFMMLSLMFEGGTAMDTADFWIWTGFILTMYATFVVMLIQIAAAQNSFVTDNRSTQIRRTMLVQTLMFTAWMSYIWVTYQVDFVPVVVLCVAGIFWTFYAALMTGEEAKLSPRARRDLPHTFFGRTFLTWFNPGSATGYVFALTTFMALVLVVLGMNLFAAANWPEIAYDVEDLIPFGLLMWSYMALYLGLGRIVIVGLRKVSDFGLVAVVLIHILILTSAAALPTFIQFWLQNFRNADYSGLQAVNWLWSLFETIDGSWVMWGVVVSMGFAGLVMYFTNLVFAAREVEATRIDAPTRVLEDDLGPETSGEPSAVAQTRSAPV